MLTASILPGSLPINSGAGGRSPSSRSVSTIDLSRGRNYYAMANWMIQCSQTWPEDPLQIHEATSAGTECDPCG